MILEKSLAFPGLGFLSLVNIVAYVVSTPHVSWTSEYLVWIFAPNPMLEWGNEGERMHFPGPLKELSTRCFTSQKLTFAPVGTTGKLAHTQRKTSFRL